MNNLNDDLNNDTDGTEVKQAGREEQIDDEAKPREGGSETEPRKEEDNPDDNNESEETDNN